MSCISSLNYIFQAIVVKWQLLIELVHSVKSELLYDLFSPSDLTSRKGRVKDTALTRTVE